MYAIIQLLLLLLVMVTGGGLVLVIELGGTIPTTAKGKPRHMISVIHQTLAIHTAPFQQPKLKPSLMFATLPGSGAN
jgi:hypothetical protein